jgi:hypothetical protein
MELTLMESFGRFPHLRLPRLRKQCYLYKKVGTNLDGIFGKVSHRGSESSAIYIRYMWKLELTLMESLEGCRACAWRGLKSSVTYVQNLELTLMEYLGRLPRLRLARPPRGRSSLLEWPLARLRNQCPLYVKAGTNLWKVAAPAHVEAQEAVPSICES